MLTARINFIIFKNVITENGVGSLSKPCIETLLLEFVIEKKLYVYLIAKV